MTDVVEAELVVLPDPQVDTDELSPSAAVQLPPPSVDTRTFYLVWQARWTGGRVLVGVFIDQSVANAEARDTGHWVEEWTVVTDIEDHT